MVPVYRLARGERCVNRKCQEELTPGAGIKVCMGRLEGGLSSGWSESHRESLGKSLMQRESLV